MLVVKEKEVSKLTEQLKAVQEEGQKDSAALEAAEQHFKAVSAGLSTNEDGEEATLAGQMMTCKNDMSKADTEAKQVSEGASGSCFMFHVDFKDHSVLLSVQAQMTLKHAQAELKTKQAEVKKMDGGYKKDQDSLQAVRSSREKLQAELDKLSYEGMSVMRTDAAAPRVVNSVTTVCVCLQTGRRKTCWTRDGSCPERSPN